MPPTPGHDRISIIVPVYNEAARIRSFLTQLRERAPAAQIIVVDGQSTDASAALAEPLCDLLIHTERGRARQMNAGARVATGEILWFLHADAEVPHTATAQIAETLRDPRVAGGFFRIQLPRDRLVYRLTDSFAHYAGMALRIRCGDHGLFCRRDVFDRIGGYPDVELMEDAQFVRALYHCGRVRVLNSRLVLSARRYEKVGALKLTLAYGLIATLYAMGVPLPWLARLYGRTCSVGERDRRRINQNDVAGAAQSSRELDVVHERDRSEAAEVVERFAPQCLAMPHGGDSLKPE